MKDDDRLLEDADLYVTFFDGNRDRRKSVEIVSGLAAEVRALRKDRERLDFIITDCSGLDFANEELARVFFAEVGNHDDMRVGFRAAFDAVMSARGGEGGA